MGIVDIGYYSKFAHLVETLINRQILQSEVTSLKELNILIRGFVDDVKTTLEKQRR